MKTTGWIALAVVVLMMVGCAKTEPVKKPADGKKKAATAEKAAPAATNAATPTEPKETTPPVTKEAPGKVSEIMEPKTKLAEPAAIDQPAAGAKKDDAQGKGGNVTGALGKALLKGMGASAKPKDQKATDDAPALKQ